MELVYKVLEIITSSSLEEDIDIKEILDKLKLGVKFVHSDLNYVADQLAKKGEKTATISNCWVQSKS